MRHFELLSCFSLIFSKWYSPQKFDDVQFVQSSVSSWMFLKALCMKMIERHAAGTDGCCKISRPIPAI